MRVLRRQDNACEFGRREQGRFLKDYALKYAVALHAWLWFPYDDKVSASVAIHKKGEENPVFVDVQTGRPLPNETIVVARTKFGECLSDGFFPIVFESFEELKKVEKVTIVWNIGDCKEFSIVEYDVSFEKPKQNGVYGLASTEYVLSDAHNLLNENTSQDVIQACGLDETKVIIGSSMYDDMYVVTYYNGEVKLVSELHAKNSNHTFDSEALILTKPLANKSKDINIAYYHSAIRLDDERIIHY